jgi:hypothetical protein
MFLRSPAEFYIKYLLVHPRRHTVEDIQRLLETTDLPFVSVAYVEGLRERLVPPDPFRPWERMHTPSQRFLSRERLQRLFLRDKAMDRAQRILETPRAKEFAETMLLTHAPRAAIAAAITKHRGVLCTPEAIDLYAHFYWNVDLLDSVAMRTLLQLRYEQLAQREDADGQALALAAKKASYQDPRKLAADLPFSPLAAMLVQMRMGMMPAKIEVSQRMEAARNLAVVRTEECLHYATPADAQRAVNYAMTAKIMNELLEVVQKPDDQLREQLSVITLRTDDKPIPSLAELGAGKHTADLLPASEATTDDESETVDAHPE